MHYNAGSKNMISFRGNSPCRVLSKLINSDLWLIEVQGRKGYAPKKMIMEQKILVKTDDLVEVEFETMEYNSNDSTQYSPTDITGNFRDREQHHILDVVDLNEETSDGKGDVSDNENVEDTKLFGDELQNSNLIPTDIRETMIPKFSKNDYFSESETPMEYLNTDISEDDDKKIQYIDSKLVSVDDRDYSGAQNSVVDKNENLLEEKHSLNNLHNGQSIPYTIKKIETEKIPQSDATILVKKSRFNANTITENLDMNVSMTSDPLKYSDLRPQEKKQTPIPKEIPINTVYKDIEMDLLNEDGRQNKAKERMIHIVSEKNEISDQSGKTDLTKSLEYAQIDEIQLDVVTEPNYEYKMSWFDEISDTLQSGYLLTWQCLNKVGRVSPSSPEKESTFPGHRHINYLEILGSMADKIAILFLTSISILIFLLGQQCANINRKETILISKLNALERKLLLKEKECSVAKVLLTETRKKMESESIADDIIGEFKIEKQRLQKHITSLEKELETAAEAGLELNKMVSELLNNQAGSESIMTSVDELQQQLNEQEANTIYISNLLSEKSRENNELQSLLLQTNEKFALKINELMKQQKISEFHLNKEMETKTNQICQLNEDKNELKIQYEELFSKWQSDSTRIEALQDVITKINTYEKEEIELIREIADANAKFLASNQENNLLRQKLSDVQKLYDFSQNQILEMSAETTKIQKLYNSSEKDKLEAQTKLEVLSNYFKEKETQLQR